MDTTPTRLNTTRLLIYPMAWIGGSWRYLLFRHTMSRRGEWHGMLTVVGTDCPAEAAVAGEVRRLTGLRVTAVRSIDYAYRYSILEHVQGRFTPVHRDVLERVYVAFVKPGSPANHREDDIEGRWFPFHQALESLEWLEHAEALQRCQVLVTAMGAPLTPADMGIDAQPTLR